MKKLLDSMVAAAALFCALFPAPASAVDCDAAMDSLRTALQNDDYEVYAAMSLNHPVFACPIEDELLALLFPTRILEFEGALQRMGIGLSDSSLHRLIWEQVRLTRLLNASVAQVAGREALPAPKSDVELEDVGWWIGAGSTSLALLLFLWGWALGRKLGARSTERVNWFPDVVAFGESIRAAKNQQEYDQAMFWLRFIEFNDRMFSARRSEWMVLSLREREMSYMLLEHWSTKDICSMLGTTEPQLYKMRSKLRLRLGLEGDDELVSALRAWSNQE